MKEQRRKNFLLYVEVCFINQDIQSRFAANETAQKFISFSSLSENKIDINISFSLRKSSIQNGCVLLPCRELH